MGIDYHAVVLLTVCVCVCVCVCVSVQLSSSLTVSHLVLSVSEDSDLRSAALTVRKVKACDLTSV